jgi:hypothetical protein
MFGHSADQFISCKDEWDSYNERNFNTWHCLQVPRAYACANCYINHVQGGLLLKSCSSNVKQMRSPKLALFWQFVFGLHLRRQPTFTSNLLADQHWGLHTLLVHPFVQGSHRRLGVQGLSSCHTWSPWTKMGLCGLQMWAAIRCVESGCRQVGGQRNWSIDTT